MDKKKENKVTKCTDDDTNKDEHSYMVMDTKFTIEKKYEIIDLIGYGAYGIVVAAKDTT